MRTSPVHYIAPSAISITPNANGSANDLAVYIARDAKIKVHSREISFLQAVEGSFQEWTLSGRNRRLADGSAPYTIYASLSFITKEAYLIFAKKQQYVSGPKAGQWYDKYSYVTQEAFSYNYDDGNGTKRRDYPAAGFCVRLGEVSAPENGLRTVTLDTGILGTEEYNAKWSLNPDALPLRIEVSCAIGGNDVGQTPYVGWGQSLALSAKLVEGWAETSIERFDHWEIARDTGDAVSDEAWPPSASAASFASSGRITLAHSRDNSDDFGGAVSVPFTITAWGTSDDSGSDGSDSSGSGEAPLVPIASLVVNVMAETLEQYELVLSTAIVSYSPQSGNYSPQGGVGVQVRATDQRGDIFDITNGQLNTARLSVEYAPMGSSAWTPLTFSGASAALAQATVPVSAFSAQQSVNVRIVRLFDSSSSSSDSSDADEGKTELSRVTIAFVRDGEDSKEREWIFFRSQTAITFGTTGQHILPSLITTGQVNPSGAAGSSTAYDNTLDGWVPTGWYDEQQGVSKSYPYEYGAYRDYIRESESSDSSSSGDTGGHWGPFSTPKIWGHFGADAVRVWLAPSATAVKMDASTREFAPSTLQCRLHRKEGDEEETDVTSGATGLMFSVNGSSPVSYDGSVITLSHILQGTGMVSFLWQHGTVIERADVPVVADGEKGDKGDKGDTGNNGTNGTDGADAYSLIVSPAVAVIQQGTEKVNDVYPLTYPTIGVTLMKGGSLCAMSSYSVASTDRRCANRTPVMNINNAQFDFQLYSLQKDANNKYYTKGSFSISVTPQGESSAINARLDWVANLLGEIKTTVEGDVETTVAEKLTYAVDPTGQHVSTLQQLGTYIRSASEKTDTISEKLTPMSYIDDGPWECFANTDREGTEQDANGEWHITTDDAWDGEWKNIDVVSPVVLLPAGTWVFSAFIDSDISPFLYEATADTEPDDMESRTMSWVQFAQSYNGKTRRYFKFKITESEYVRINLYKSFPSDYSGIGSFSFYWPMLEHGDQPSAIDPTNGMVEVATRFKQTSRQITLEVNDTRDGLKRTGVDITAGKISAQADKFEVVNLQGDKTLEVDQYGNLKTAGSAYFGGKMKADQIYYKIQSMYIDTTTPSFVDVGVTTVIVGTDGNQNRKVVLPYPNNVNGMMVNIIFKKTDNNVPHGPLVYSKNEQGGIEDAADMFWDVLSGKFSSRVHIDMTGVCRLSLVAVAPSISAGEWVVTDKTGFYGDSSN